MEAPTISALLRELRDRFREAGSETPDLDARLLMEAALELDRAGFILRGAEPMEEGALHRILAWAERRCAGEPVHRILGRRAFASHEFALSPETLEPRPDTETLVDLASLAMAERGRGPVLFADIGTGSGAIAVSLLHRFPEATCVAVDLSPGALATACENAASAGVEARFWPLASDYLAALGARLDLVVSNPPYIPTGELAGLDVGVRRFDPTLALDGGADGLVAYRRIVEEARDLLGEDGDLLFEIGRGQEGDVEALARSGGFQLHRADRDLGGIVRALWFRRDNAPVFSA
ncbi:peptide chain release factor N(5)-glutamine methyltransferase [Aureimonas sp. ME7]|uniref:peptide chain release factor N(5)-glutamine methyltransferase n=1 Tax=Aureimonas sp. ME7 TaxID=2744252 RepID=UPI0015F45DA3|nr:peptide chain release factor N(5)-glutamine methyltransferase [Aureimonas sp. ME7]